MPDVKKNFAVIISLTKPNILQSIVAKDKRKKEFLIV